MKNRLLSLFVGLACLSGLAQPAHCVPAQDPPTDAPKQAPAKIEYLSAWPKPADQHQLEVDIERLCKARTDEMEKQAQDALLACGTSAVPFLLDRYARERAPEAHERLRALLLDLIQADQTRLLAPRFASKSLDERVMVMWRAGVFPDRGIRAEAEAAWARVEKQGEKADPDERYAAALCACSAGCIKGLDTLIAQAMKRWDKKGQEMRIALEGVRGPDATAALSKSLDDQDRKIRVAALNLLGGCGDKSVIGKIKPMLDESDNSIRVAAINALRGIVDGELPLKDLSAFTAIEEAKKWKDRL
ncbi:MAG: HEAT repeat domain-containing protein [Planctomycetes bacterium]|nr:HEAT repeat domain-containing protein [Planctomycetota bacterium]